MAAARCGGDGQDGLCPREIPEGKGAKKSKFCLYEGRERAYNKKTRHNSYNIYQYTILDRRGN